MPLQFNKFIEPLGIYAIAIPIAWSIITTSASPIDKTLIESAILINHEELTDPGSLHVSSRFRRATISEAFIEGNLTSTDLNKTVFILDKVLPSDLASTMEGLFFGAKPGNTNEEIKSKTTREELFEQVSKGVNFNINYDLKYYYF